MLQDNPLAHQINSCTVRAFIRKGAERELPEGSKAIADHGIIIDSETIQERSPVVDYDFYLDRRYEEAGDHHLALKQLAEETPPVFWSPALGGYWVIRSHELAFEAARSTDLFSSRAMNIPADENELLADPAIPINVDPPDHAMYRAPLAELFGPQRMARMEAKIRKLTVGLIEAVRKDGECDFVKAIAEPIPVVTFMDLVGMEHSRLREFRELAIVGSVDPDPERRIKGQARVNEIMAEFVGYRFRNPEIESDDITSQLIRARIGERPITEKEVLGYFRLLFFAGLDTVVNAMAFGSIYLARHPDVQKRMRSGEADMRLSIEELLRLGAPARLGRIVTRDEIWHGVSLRRGDRVLLELAAANFDACVFPDPIRFDSERQSINHLTFNSGPHRCIGQHLARIELRVFYEEWLSRIGPFRLDPERPRKVHGGLVMGVDTLPILWEVE